jgi:hypothetical protein
MDIITDMVAWPRKIYATVKYIEKAARNKWDESVNPTRSKSPQGRKILSKQPQGTIRPMTGARWLEIHTNGFDMRPRLVRIRPCTKQVAKSN